MTDHRGLYGDQRRSGQAEQSPAEKSQFVAMAGHVQDTIEQLAFHQIFVSPVEGPGAHRNGR